MDLDYYSVTRGIATLQFNPDRCPHATLKAFKELIQQFDFAISHSIQYTPLKNATDCKIKKMAITE